MEKMRGAAVVVALAAMASGCASDAVSEEEAAMRVVEEAYAAFNSGDVERWVEVREAGSYFASEEDREESAVWLTGVTEAQVAAGAEFTEIECESLGEGEWSGIADGEVAQGFHITCETVLTPETVEFAGPTVFEWVVADDTVVAVTSVP